VRILVAVSITLAGVLTLSAAAAQQPAPADDPRFTGISTVLDAKDLSAARRRFEPGARSAWHSHVNGQLLFVEKGRGRTQKRGMAMREMGPGDSDYTGPNVIHWHGAVPSQEFIQINVGFGGETKWMEKTTDEEYGGKIRK
jgi:quercetin dioxygenase-like cupin family protein